MNPDKLMKTPEVAAYLTLKEGTIRKMVQAETIPFIRFSHCCVRFDRKAIDKWLAQKTVTPVPKPLSLLKRKRRHDAA